MMLVAFLIGWFATYILIDSVDFNKSIIPWAIIPLLLFPSGFCAQALFKIAESNENATLTRSELRRLKPIIDAKKTKLVFLLVFYMISALVIVGLLLTNQLSSPLSEHYKYIMPICSGLILSSLASFFYIKSVMDEIQSFKSVLMHRAEEQKRTKELLDELSKD